MRDLALQGFRCELERDDYGSWGWVLYRHQNLGETISVTYDEIARGRHQTKRGAVKEAEQAARTLVGNNGPIVDHERKTIWF